MIDNFFVQITTGIRVHEQIFLFWVSLIVVDNYLSF